MDDKQLTALQLSLSVWVVKSSVGLTGDGTGTSALASRDHNEQFHDTIVDLGTPALHDEDILVTNRCIDANTGLAIAKFLEITFGRLSTKTLAD